MRKTIMLVAFTFASSGCSASCSVGKPVDSNSPDGKPISSSDDDRR